MNERQTSDLTGKNREHKGEEIRLIMTRMLEMYRVSVSGLMQNCWWLCSQIRKKASQDGAGSREQPHLKIVYLGFTLFASFWAFTVYLASVLKIVSIVLEATNVLLLMKN